MLLYLHGFRSVGLCYKGSLIASFAPNALTPNLPYVPDLAIELIENFIKKYQKTQKICLVGSSLGGYYATFLAEKYQLKAVLINPVINAYQTLLPAIGKVSISYNRESFIWTLDLVESLKKYYVEAINPSLYCVLLQKGDRILDYRVAAQKFKDSKLVIEEGGSHHFDNFLSQKDLLLSWDS
ncbi:MAG: YqiA/YcfP family alpha/beta fold hydrolase [Helicobacter sp.]|uniref:YqiA/YcfP family alpha/beta fold hydrolase n=1 Tax=Helicobacter sp. TaxID=218 RepID=UPI002A910B70|nr:YqiA/YcfP family alpha/beta fold hydrolase [Helicobacter sp.]MDY5615704.1 YqiA/YcfP family alpha/beta fold hydrolase [Helicobacter sp.]